MAARTATTSYSGPAPVAKPDGTTGGGGYPRRPSRDEEDHDVDDDDDIGSWDDAIPVGEPTTPTMPSPGQPGEPRRRRGAATTTAGVWRLLAASALIIVASRAQWAYLGGWLQNKGFPNLRDREADQKKKKKPNPKGK